jgi:hypothetical protein
MRLRGIFEGLSQDRELADFALKNIRFCLMTPHSARSISVNNTFKPRTVLFDP